MHSAKKQKVKERERERDREGRRREEGRRKDRGSETKVPRLPFSLEPKLEP